MEQNFDKFQNLIYNFIKYCKKKDINLSKENFEFDGLLYAKKKNIVLALNDKIIIDKEGLVKWGILCNEYLIKKSNPNYLFSENHALLLHPLFEIINVYGYTPSLIDELWKVGKTQSLSIAIDLDRVRINIDDKIDRPLAGWGAKYKIKIDEIDNNISHYYHEENYTKRILKLCFNSALSLDTKWKTRGNIKTFEAEELKLKDFQKIYKNTKYYPSKYFHSTYLVKEKYFSHLDGAIHLYNEEEYLKRSKNSLNFNKNSTEHIKPTSIKLFKINGLIDIQTWESLTSKFYAGNPYIIEYFEGKFPQNTKNCIKVLNKKDPEPSSG